jgi:hypothetical protein
MVSEMTMMELFGQATGFVPKTPDTCRLNGVSAASIAFA